jgi:hypothetical protein
MIAIPVHITLTTESEELLVLGAADMCNMPVGDWMALLAVYGEVEI